MICFADVNECVDGLDDCSPDARCINTAGSFDCDCLPAFEGNGRVCTAIVLVPSLVNECANQQDNCSPAAECIDLANGYDCRCLAGYLGDGRVCTGNTLRSSCLSLSLYVYAVSGIDLNECNSGSGSCPYSHSHCVNLVGSYRCECDYGYAPWGRMCMGESEISRSI